MEFKDNNNLKLVKAEVALNNTLFYQYDIDINGYKINYDKLAELLYLIQSNPTVDELLTNGDKIVDELFEDNEALEKVAPFHVNNEPFILALLSYTRFWHYEPLD